MSFTRITGPGISSYPVISGIITALNFKSGTTNIHNVGVEAAGINVLGGDTPIGTGATIFKDGSVRFGHTGNNNTGIVTANKVDAPTITATTVTATTFSGDGSNLTSLPAGLGTALSSTQTSPLNKLYYTDNVLSIGATITVDPPPSASAAYTQYTDIVVEDTADLIMGDGDDLVPDVLGLSTETATVYSATGGRIRAGTFTNAGANGAPTATNGWIVTGVSTATTFKGAIDASTGAFSSNVTISGNLGVAGTITYEDVARVDATGISTFREGFGVGPLAGIALTAYKDGSIRTSGIITANTYYGSGANLTGIDATQIVTGNTSVQTVDTGSDGHVKVTTEGTERFRIASDGKVGVNTTAGGAKLTVDASSGYSIIANGNSNAIALGSNGVILFGNKNAAAYAAGGYDATEHIFKASGSEKIRIGSAGQFGIGGANYGSSGQVLTSGGASAAPSWAAAGGVTYIDQWHYTTNQDLSSQDPLTGWTHSTHAANARLGTAMTESSGTWSFPATGMWLVSFSCWYYANARSSRWMQSRINTTEDNSSYNQASAASNAIYNTGSNGYNSAYSQFIFDVTNTTNCKVRFSVDSQATLQYMGGRNFTSVKFIRLCGT